MFLVELSTSTTSHSTRSDVRENLPSATIASDDKTSLSSLEHVHTDEVECEWTYVSSPGELDNDLVCLEQGLPPPDVKTNGSMSEHVPSSDQLTESDMCAKPVSLCNGHAHSSGQSDTESLQSFDAAGVQSPSTSSQLSSSKRQSGSPSSADQPKPPEHSVISSSLKNISHNEDEGLVYVVCSKPGINVAR